MSAVLRLLLAAGFVVVVALILLRPERLRPFARQIRIVGFLYVVVVLLSAVVRLSATIDWS